MRYGPEYWDKYGAYRTPIAFHLSLLVLLRSYFIWIMAALSRRPDLDIMSLFFSSKSDFFCSIGIAAIALLPAVIFCLRRPQDNPDSAKRLASIWRFMRWPLILCAIIDLGWLTYQAAHSHYQFSLFLACQMVIVLWVLLYLLKSRYLSVFFNDWPDPIIKKGE
jgi:cytochrome bd-type quinol oxidase subunit 2